MNVNKNTFEPCCLSTLIGSLPVDGYQNALELINKYTPQIPLWPQMPSNPLEGMMNQFIEGLPGVIEEDGKTYFNLEYDGFENDQLKFYEEYLINSENHKNLLKSRFNVSENRAVGIYNIKKSIQTSTEKHALKGQVTGPFTLLVGLVDQNKRLGYYNQDFRDMAVKNLAMKAAWQVEFLKDQNLPTIIFIDEPALAGLGSSSYISIDKNDIKQDLSEVINAIKKSGGLAGIHVCANTDWNFLLSIDLDILSFDSHGYFDRFITCKPQIHDFLDRGGIVAWGIIPTDNTDIINKSTTDQLVDLWEMQIDQLVGGKWDKKSIFKQSMITPSCGTGALDLESSMKVLDLTQSVSNTIRNRYL